MNLWKLFTKSSRAPRSSPGRAYLRLEPLETRLVPYSVSGNAWPHPELITLSFEPDGTNLGGVTSNLFATLNAKWAPSVWQYQFLKAAQAYAQVTNINFALVNDSGADSGSGSYEQGDPTFGDIRIGGYAYGSSTLSSAMLPPQVNNYSIAGDLTINTAQPWVIGTTGGYDLFTAVSHEIGHSLGLLHSSTYNADLYAYYTSLKTSLKSDDIAGIQNIYSNNNPRSRDAFGGTNNSFATAANLSAQIDPTALTALVTNLDVTTTSQVDYYTFTAPAATTGTLKVNVQSSGLSLLAPALTVYAADQTTVLGTASGAGQYGTSLSVTVNGVSAGQQFYVKVAGADASAFGTGKFALTLNFGSSPSSTVPLPNTQTLNGTPLSGGGGVAFARQSPNSVGRTDDLTVEGFNSLQHGGGCGCPACRAAAAALQTPQILMAGPAAAPFDAALESATTVRSIVSLRENAQEQTFGETFGTASPASGAPWSPSLRGTAARTESFAPLAPFSRSPESRADGGNGKGVRTTGDEQPAQAPASFDGEVRLPAAAPLSITDPVLEIRAGAIPWQQACDACFAEPGASAAGAGAAETADGKSPEAVAAAALAGVLAGSWNSRPVVEKKGQIVLDRHRLFTRKLE